MIERDYYPLNLAAEKFGYTEDDFLYLGSRGKLPIYIYRPYCAYRKYSSPNITWHIKVPILIDDPDCLSGLALGVDSMMRFSEQYPDSWLVDLSAVGLEMVFDNSQTEVYENNCKELSSRQKDKLIADGRLSVFVEEFSDSDSFDGIPITRDRVVIMAADLKLLPEISTVLPESSIVQELIIKDQSESVEDDDATKGGRRRDKQINFICDTARVLKYDLLKIPEGGKPAIKTECLKNTGLFTDSGFSHAWKEANNRRLIRIQDKEKYLSNQ